MHTISVALQNNWEGGRINLRFAKHIKTNINSRGDIITVQSVLLFYLPLKRADYP